MTSEGDKPPPIVEREIPYRMRWTTLVLLLTIFPLFTLGAMWLMRSWEGEILVINGVELGVTGTRIFHWFALLLSGGFTSLALFLLFRRLTDPPRVLIIRNDAIVLPPGWRRPLPTVVRYADITAINTGDPNQVQWSESILIDVGKQRHTIESDMLPSKSEFYEVLRTLQARRP